MMINMMIILNQIHIANALLCLLLAAQLLAMTAMRPIPKRLLALNYLLYAHQSLMLVGSLAGYTQSFSYMRPLVAMVLGPALYAYFSCVRRDDTTIRIGDGVHFCVGLLIFALLSSIKPLRGFIDYAILASFIVYFSLIVWQLRHGKKPLVHLGGYASSAYRWLLSLMMMAGINIVLEIAVAIEMENGVALRDSVSLVVAAAAFLLLNSLTMLAAMYRSDWLEWMYQFGEQTRQKPAAQIDIGLATALFQRWEALVRTENLYKQEFGITLTLAARKLHVPARQLSNAINQLYGKSFSVHLNDLRIHEAQRLLLAHPEMPVTEVMQESGFSSKSNFNKEFLRVAKVSPTVFREATLADTPKPT
jgi:AraC-like DNA-binding protein